MKLKNLFFTLLVLAGIAAVPAMAQENSEVVATSSEPMVLTLEQALEIALSDNPTVKIADKTVYVAGDCDVNEDNRKVKCDIAFVPAGGKYTMDYREAAELVNLIKPELANPTHYGNLTGEKSTGEQFAKLVDPSIKVELLI